MKKISKKNKKVVFVGVSGGVDSALSAYLLKKKGYEVVGVFIKTWQPDFIKCTEEEEKRDAMRVCAYLNIPFLLFNLEKEYKKKVGEYMINEYKKGRTPNPDVMCNKEVKFGGFLKKAQKMGADFVATGHYARKKNFSLIKGKDASKDQSYFLWTLSQKQLSKILFPIGNLKKSQVRKLAKKINLPVAEKKDSQGICFLGKVNLKEFLGHYIKEEKGKVLNERGDEIGFHKGILFFTLGERHGFTITKKGINDKPYYVIAKDIKKNILYVSNNKNYFQKKSNSYVLNNVNWICEEPKEGKNYTAQIRYHGELLKCKVITKDKKEAKIIFKKNILVDKGQSIVIYDKNICLGGGIVS